MGALSPYQNSRWPPLLIFSGSRKKDPRYASLSEAKALHRQWICAEDTSSVSHILHNGLSLSPIRWRCLLRVLCPVRRQLTALDCILLKDKYLNLVSKQGPEINYRDCLCLLPKIRHYPNAGSLTGEWFYFLDPAWVSQRWLWSHEPCVWTTPFQPVGSFITS
jgi:hypothetical protein